MSRQHNSRQTPPGAAPSDFRTASITRSVLHWLLPGLPLAFCLGYVVAGLRAGSTDDIRATTSTAISAATPKVAALPSSPQPVSAESSRSNRRSNGHIADRFRDADMDGDGMLSRDEAKALRGVSQRFALIDANQDGRISRAELAQYRQQSKRRHRAGSQSPAAMTSLSEQPAEQGRRR